MVFKKYLDLYNIEPNVLIGRLALLEMKENGECVYNLFELMMVSSLFIEREYMNVMKSDMEFFQEFLEIPDFSREKNKREVDEYVTYCVGRLEAAVR